MAKVLNKKSEPKNLSELVVTEKFFVERVTSGAYYERKSTRFTPEIFLTVVSVNNTPVGSLHFYGVSSVKKGDYIFAKIPRYLEEGKASGLLRGFPSTRRTHFERDFKDIESAIELGILSSKDGEIIRTDRPVDWSDF